VYTLYVANVTPAGTYFSLKLAMLLSLVAEVAEVRTCAVWFVLLCNNFN